MSARVSEVESHQSAAGVLMNDTHTLEPQRRGGSRVCDLTSGPSQSLKFAPNNLVEFVGRKLLSPFPNSGSPYPVGAWPGDDTAQVGGNSECKTIRSRPPRKGAQ